jgi:hypothetical protein
VEWERKYKINKKKNSQFSVSQKLRKQRKSSDEFEFMIGQLSLEEIIALKLELAYKAIGFQINIPIWKSVNKIVKDAMFKYVVSVSKNKNNAMKMLGLNPADFNKLAKIYKLDKYRIKQND